MTRNAATLVDPVTKAGTKLDDALEPEETHKVLRTAKGDRLEALAVLVLGVGLRRGEAIALRGMTSTSTPGRSRSGRRRRRRDGARSPFRRSW